MNQIAVCAVQFNHIETGIHRAFHRLLELLDNLLDFRFAQFQRRGEVLAFKIQLAVMNGRRRYALAVLRFAAGVGDLNADFRAVLMHAGDDFFKHIALFVVPQAQAVWRNAAVGRDIGHLDNNQTHAADGAGGVMHFVPVVRHTVLRRVLAHRRHHHSVAQREVFQGIRLI